MRKQVLLVTTQFLDEIEARIDRDYEACRNPHQRPFTRDELIEASSGADALFITPLDRLDSEFFERVSASVKVIATYRSVLTTSTSRLRRIGKSPLRTRRESTRMPRQTSRCCSCWVRHGGAFKSHEMVRAGSNSVTINFEARVREGCTGPRVAA